MSSTVPSRREIRTSLRGTISWQRIQEEAIRGILFCCALLSIMTTVAIIFVLVTESLLAFPPNTAFFQDVHFVDFFFGREWSPQYDPPQYGVAPLICGTFLITGISGLIGLPAGLLIAIYLSEYATPRARGFCKPLLEILAGIPTVVYGYFGLTFLTPFVIMPVFGLLGITVQGFNALSGGIVVGIMIIPMVASLSEDVLQAVPSSLREAGYALGSTKFDVSTKIVVPSALSGVIASFLLALSRSIGETMAVAICAGNTPNLTTNPFVGIQTMTTFIVNVMQGEVIAGSTLEKSLYSVALVLFVITLSMNLASQIILEKYREAYQ